MSLVTNFRSTDYLVNLETFLTQWRGSFILVSHDNRLLDKVTSVRGAFVIKPYLFFRLPCSQARQESKKHKISVRNIVCDAQQRDESYCTKCETICHLGKSV